MNHNTRPGQAAGAEEPRADVTTAAAAVEAAAAWLAIWTARAPGPDATARRAASSAIAAIDDALAELHTARARLITETRRSDDETDARADALLDAARGYLGQHGATLPDALGYAWRNEPNPAEALRDVVNEVLGPQAAAEPAEPAP